MARIARTHPDGARHRLAAYDGLWRSRPALALVLAFALLCLAGLPPGVMGLVAKIVALVPVIGAGGWWLVAVAVANVALGVAVYLRWGLRLFTTENVLGAASQAGPHAARQEQGRPRMPARLALSLAAAGCVALSILPEGLIGLLAGAPLH